MEIQRKIVEAKNPPSNREVWWFDTNTEVLKRYTGNAWVQVVDSAETEYGDPGTIVKTTYEEVRELYNSGKMDPNVKYEFEYVFTPCPGYTYTVPNLRVYLTQNGELKAEGKWFDEGSSGIYESFKSDFEFDSLATSFTLDDQTYNIKEYIPDTISFKMSMIVMNDRESKIEKLHNIYSHVDPKVNLIYDNESESIIVTLHDANPIYFYDESLDYEEYIVISKSGICILDPDKNTIDVNNIKLGSANIKANIYNINYDSYFHSTLVNTDYLGDLSSYSFMGNIEKCAKDDYLNWDNLIDLIYGNTYISGYIYNSSLDKIEKAYCIDFGNDIIVICNQNLARSDA